MAMPFDRHLTSRLDDVIYTKAIEIMVSSIVVESAIPVAFVAIST